MRKEAITELICGFLINPAFKIYDIWGEITDDILYHSDCFSTELFPQVTADNLLNRALVGKNGDSLTFDNNNIIFKQVIVSDFDKEFDLFKKRAAYIANNILIKHHFICKRIGVVYSYKLDNTEKTEVQMKYFNPDVDGVDHFRLSRKEAVSAGTFRKGIDNFYNTIITMRNSSGDDESNSIYSFDYQLFFVPPREDVSTVLKSFIQRSFDKFKEELDTGHGKKKKK